MRGTSSPITVAFLLTASLAFAETLPPTLWKEPVAALAKAGTLDGVRVDGDALTLENGKASGTFTSAEHAIPPSDKMVVSWNIRGAGGKVELALRAKVGGAWTAWGVMGVWTGGQGSGCLKGQDTAVYDVDCDTFEVKGGKTADRIQMRATVDLVGSAESPRITLLTATFWKKGKSFPLSLKKSPAWGKTVDVKPRSQMVEDKSIRGEICSATSTAQVLAYWGIDFPTRKVCDGVIDRGHGIWGNWPCNTAFAGSADPSKLREAYIVHFYGGFADVEAEIAAGRPVIVGHCWGPKDLDGAPIPKSDGHLIVIVGFTKDGDVVVNDPAANPEKGQEVRRVYKRAQLHHTWQEMASGIAYILLPTR